MPQGFSLRTSELTVAFNGDRALDRVTLEIPRGVSVALLGPNGAGKSTLFRAAVGLVDPRSGRVELGVDRVAFVPQHLDVEPAFPVTAADVVRMGRYGELGWLRRFGERDHSLVAESLRALGVEELSTKRFGDLSGGQRQRVLLAQAAAQEAELMLLDEPFTGVDRPTHEALRDLLRRWRDQGRSIVVATHDLESAARDFDLVLCLNRRLVAFGPPAQTCVEDVLAETFAGHVVRVGDLVVDVAHHHHGAG
ncbi:MAG TPA: metal ABC transporter ATP-binding protein [Solirubrobacterales bacterium]|nr:metal ABC transporter ATP-binding protein [Solirubrobacterales bacterium]